MSRSQQRWAFIVIVMVVATLLVVAFAECPETHPPYERLCEGGPAKSRDQGCHNLLRWEPVAGSMVAYEVERKGWLFARWRPSAIVQERPWNRSDVTGEICRYDTPEGERVYWFFDGEANPRPGKWRRYRLRVISGTARGEWTPKVGRWNPIGPGQETQATP